MKFSTERRRIDYIFFLHERNTRDQQLKNKNSMGESNKHRNNPQTENVFLTNKRLIKNVVFNQKITRIE